MVCSEDGEWSYNREKEEATIRRREEGSHNDWPDTLCSRTPQKRATSPETKQQLHIAPGV